MRLDIIIPHYREKIANVLIVLNSIEKQIDYDFSETTVTIMNDFGARELDFSKFDFPFMLQQFHMPEKRTLGELRQYAVDHTSADYLLWCDSDDCFINQDMLRIFNETVEEHPDVEIVFTPYFSEHCRSDGTYYYLRETDYISTGTLHGKLFSRKFIDKIGLKFMHVNVSEDTAYCFNCFNLSTKSIYREDAASYLYRFNPNSVTRDGNPFNDIPSINVRCFAKSLVAYERMCDTVIENKDNPDKGVFTTDAVGAFLQSTFYYYNLYKLAADQINTPESLEALAFAKNEFDRIVKKYIKYYNDKELYYQREQIIKNMPLFKDLKDIDFVKYYKEL